MSSQARARIIISGKVQGVFFRYTMCQEAERRKVHGWGKNCRDGTVEAVVEGEKEAVESLISWCCQGPLGAVVRKVDVEWQEYRDEFNSFSIKDWS